MRTGNVEDTLVTVVAVAAAVAAVVEDE